MLETGLSPDAYIEHLVARAGGRIEQREVVAQTGWPKSTVSEMLGELETRGRIARVANGNGKVVVLPDCCPEAVDGRPEHLPG